MKRAAWTSSLIFLFLVIGTAIAIIYARGYRIIPQPEGLTLIEGTGLLVLTSNPDGSKVFINDKLTTATNNTINLAPGSYEVKITKEGYIPWQKTVDIKNELVTQADALLIPVAPRLEAITLTGAQNPVVDPTGRLITYTVSSASAERNGIYVLDMNVNPILALGGGATHITDESRDQFSRARLTFSPDGKDLLATISAFPGSRTYLFPNRASSQNPQNVTGRLSVIQQEWEEQQLELSKKELSNLKKGLIELYNQYFNNPKFSPEADKILYKAAFDASLPVIIKPRLISTNSTPETRNIIEGNLYVYDIKEDRNYLLLNVQGAENATIPTYVWHPDSNHLLYVANKKIYLIEYDGGNNTTIYSGPFEDYFMYPWPDGSRIVILTNLNSSTLPHNLYTISLK